MSDIGAKYRTNKFVAGMGEMRVARWVKREVRVRGGALWVKVRWFRVPNSYDNYRP